MNNPPVMYLLIFLSSFGFIFLKSFQQLNVVKKQYWWIVPTSVIMAGAEVYVITTSARNGWDWWLVLLIGFGSGFGSLSATYLHSKWFKEIA